MKKIVLLILLLGIQFNYSQNDVAYFTGERTHCGFKNDKERKLYDLGLQSLQYKEYVGTSTNIFLEIIKNDSTQCDSYFFAGYTLRLQNKFKEATVFYYMADSLSDNKSLIIKQNLATTAAYSGGFELARKKYNEIIEYFPKSPEGYYGIASSSIFIGDFENGLTNVNEAIVRYKSNGIKIGKEVYLTKAILLTRTKKYKESLIYFDQISGKMAKDDVYKTHYAFSLKKVGVLTKNQKMLKKADKIYNKIKDKSVLTKEVKSVFNK